MAPRLRVVALRRASPPGGAAKVRRSFPTGSPHRALDRGITLIDTANVYGRGAAEEVLGEALAGIGRDRYVLATKLYFPMSSTDRGLSREQILKQLDASLGRLRVSHIDLYQCHRYDADTPLEETMRASDAVRSGKVRYIGFSVWARNESSAAPRPRANQGRIALPAAGRSAILRKRPNF